MPSPALFGPPTKLQTFPLFTFLPSQKYKNLRVQELKFAFADGCVQCAGIAYDMYPKWSWPDFCKAFAESKVVRESYALAQKILDGSASQPFKSRSAVDMSACLGVRLERPYLALTEQEVLSLFKLPPEGFDSDLKQVTLSSEGGEPTVYYLFEHGFRTAYFYSLNQLQLQELLLEPHKQLRKEQPFERYQMLAKQQVDARKPQPPPGIKGGKSSGKILTLDEAHARAAAIIQAREQKEQQQDSSMKPSEVQDFEDALHREFEFAAIETLEPSLTSAGNLKPAPKANKRKTNPKAASKKAARFGGGTGQFNRPEPEKSPRSASPGTSVRGGGGRDSAGAGAQVLEDDLATEIRNKIGDVRSVANLDVDRVLRGEALGRSLNGAPWPV